MGSLTLTAALDELEFLFSNRGDTGFSVARRTRWLNAAYLHFTHPSVHPHREMQAQYTATLATGVNEYPIDPTTVGFTIVSIRNVYHIMATAVTPTARRRKLNPKGHRWFDERSIGPGSPSNYAIDGTTLYVSAAPTSSENGQLIRMRVWREPTLLVAGADVTALPAYWDQVLLLGAQWIGERDLGYRDRAELTKGDYMALVNEFKPRSELEAEDTGWEVELTGSEGRML